MQKIVPASTAKKKKRVKIKSNHFGSKTVQADKERPSLCDFNKYITDELLISGHEMNHEVRFVNYNY